MSTDLMNVEAFKGLKPAQAFQVLDPHSESLADGIGSSYGHIHYKGKVWTLRLRGQNYIFTRPDDGSAAPFLDCIILRAPSYKSKSYYPAGTFQDGQAGVRPTCSAINGVTPDADILTPQSNACATCPRNVFKLNAEGRKTRECADYKRLAILVIPSMTAAILGAPLMEPVFLRIPPASLNDLAQFGDSMQGQGFHFSTFITRIGFNPEKPHPQMTFRAVQPLEDSEAALVLPMREDSLSFRITGENEVAGIPLTGAAAQLSAQPDAAANAAAAAQQAAAAAAAAAAKAAAEAAAKAAAEAAAKAAAEAAALAAAPVRINTGFGSLTGAPAPVTAAVKPAAPTVNTVADTGAPEEADDDLDAKVAMLLPKV